MRSRAALVLVALALGVAAIAWLRTERGGTERALAGRAPAAEAPRASPVLARELDVPEDPAEVPTRSSDSVGLAEGASSALAQSSLPATTVVSIRGRVVCLGREVAGLDIAALDPAGVSRQPDARNGMAFEFHDLPTGTYAVRASAHGWKEAMREVQVPHPEALALELDLEPRPVVRIDVVTPDGRPFLPRLLEILPHESPQLAPAVVATLEPLPAGADAAVFAGQVFGVGRFQTAASARLPPECLGVLELLHDPPLEVSLVFRQIVLGVQRLAPGVERLEFVLDPEDFAARLSTLRFQCVDAETREPVAYGGVLLHCHPTHFAIGLDEKGACECGPLAPGPASLRIDAKGYRSLVLPIEIAGGGVTDLGTLSLERASKVHVRISMPDEVVNAIVYAFPVADVLRRNATAMHVGRVVAAPGEADMDLGSEEVVLWAEAEDLEWKWRSRLQRFDPSSGLGEIALALEPTAPLHLEPASGVPRAIEITDAQGFLVLHGPLRLETAPIKIDLPAGAYRVQVRRLDGRESSTDVLIGPTGARITVD